MKLFRKLTALLLAILLVTGNVPVITQASQQQTIEVSTTYINPLYADVITEDDLPRVSSSGIATCSEPHYLTSVADAAVTLREQMQARMVPATVYIQDSSITDEESLAALGSTIFHTALNHTGEPVEGDYLRWQYGGVRLEASAMHNGTAYEITFTYTIDYYTTTEQEQQVDTAINVLLADLDLSESTDYEKILSIYDYICENVTYDHNNLEDDEYDLKYTAYAALINKTAVCQGYALLFYRLALELGVDSRLIAGLGNGGAHGWNIVTMDSLYYNIDSTWDAGKTVYSCFLKNETNFVNHTRYDEYNTAEFHQEYPMGTADFKLDLCTHSNTTVVTANTVSATCEEPGSYDKITYCTICGIETATQTFTIDALGHTWGEGTITKEPTEKETGIRTYTCATCGNTKTEEIPVLDHVHSYTSVVTEPTCTAAGYTTYTCSCGDTYTDDEVSALGHTEEVDKAVAPTCTETGLTEGTHCTVCNEIVIAQEEVAATGHSWDEGIVTKEPTEEEAGTRIYTCTTCGETMTEEVPYEPTTDNCVKRISGANRFETSMKVADELKVNLGVEKFDAIVVASGNAFADALSGSYLANVKKAPILLSWMGDAKFDYLNDNVVAYIQENLAEGGMVYILGSDASVPKTIDSALTESGIMNKRLAGVNRFETNLEILKEAGVTAGQDVLVCGGTHFADSLSASATGRPVLMVYNESGKLTDSQKEYLAGLNGVSFCITGDENAIGKKLEAEISEYGEISRLAGKNRFETSVLVAQKYFVAPENVVLAYAWNFPDGLCGGTLAYSMDAPLILTMTDYESYGAADYVSSEEIETGFVLGGAEWISDDTVRTIFQLDADVEIEVK